MQNVLTWGPDVNLDSGILAPVLTTLVSINQLNSVDLGVFK